MQRRNSYYFPSLFASLKYLALALLTFSVLYTPLKADTPPPPPGKAALTADEAHELLDTLNNPQKREAFAHNLSLMEKGLPAALQPATNPNSAVVHYGMHQIGSDLSYHFDNFINLFKNLKYVGLWFKDTMSNAQARTILLTALADALFIIIIGMVAERAISISLRSTLRSITDRALKRERQEQAYQHQQSAAASPSQQADTSSDAQAATVDKEQDQKKGFEVLRYFVRIPYNGMHFIVKLCPVLVFWLLSIFIADYLLPKGSTEHHVALLLINTYGISRAIYLIIETTLAPHSSIIRLVPVKDETALMLTRWWMFFVTTPAFIVCMSVLGKEFHLAQQGIVALLRAVVLLQHLIVAAFIWRVRRLVAHALQPSRLKRRHLVGAFLGTLAHIWWIPVMFVDLALWFVWAAHLKNGYHHILLGTVLTFILLFIGRITALLTFGLENRMFTLSPRLTQHYPELQQRANFYYPYVHKITSFIILLVIGIFMLQSWGIPSFSFFFESSLGKHLLGALFCFITGGAIAALFWEFVSELTNKRINYYTQKENFSRASRLKTIKPIMQTVLLTVIIVFVGVTTLAQLGINVTPLLTGAGILGVGLSFGSQSLVKDVITGFFMLAEDSIHVGDWVSTGSIAGNVEHLSIRTLRLRSIDGDLHIIPFSSVTSIANTGRDFNQIIIEMVLEPDEKVRQQAVKIMQDTVEEMRQEPKYKRSILSGYMDNGVDSSNGSGATTVGTIKTAPMKKWEIKREFYRRIGPLMAKANIPFYDSAKLITTPDNGPLHLKLDNPAIIQNPTPSNTQNQDGKEDNLSGEKPVSAESSDASTDASSTPGQKKVTTKDASSDKPSSKKTTASTKKATKKDG